MTRDSKTRWKSRGADPEIESFYTDEYASNYCWPHRRYGMGGYLGSTTGKAVGAGSGDADGQKAGADGGVAGRKTGADIGATGDGTGETGRKRDGRWISEYVREYTPPHVTFGVGDGPVKTGYGSNQPADSRPRTAPVGAVGDSDGRDSFSHEVHCPDSSVLGMFKSRPLGNGSTERSGYWANGEMDGNVLADSPARRSVTGTGGPDSFASTYHDHYGPKSVPRDQLLRTPLNRRRDTNSFTRQPPPVMSGPTGQPRSIYSTSYEAPKRRPMVMPAQVVVDRSGYALSLVPSQRAAVPDEDLSRTTYRDSFKGVRAAPDWMVAGRTGYAVNERRGVGTPVGADGQTGITEYTDKYRDASALVRTKGRSSTGAPNVVDRSGYWQNGSRDVVTGGGEEPAISAEK